ncbi:MAG: hypothetical protein R3F07_10485 [Opitutaceae bacterium]
MPAAPFLQGWTLVHATLPPAWLTAWRECQPYAGFSFGRAKARPYIRM